MEITLESFLTGKNRQAGYRARRARVLRLRRPPQQTTKFIWPEPSASGRAPPYKQTGAVELVSLLTLSSAPSNMRAATFYPNNSILETQNQSDLF